MSTLTNLMKSSDRAYAGTRMVDEAMYQIRMRWHKLNVSRCPDAREYERASAAVISVLRNAGYDEVADRVASRSARLG